MCTFAFPLIAPIWDLTFVDAISDPGAVRQVIESFSGEQRVAHAWITGTLDVAYPLAYGAFFAGSARHFFPRYGWLAWPGLVVVPVDLLEGLVQILALLDVTDFVDAKALLTPAKTLLFLVGLAITVCGWVKWAVAFVKSR